jgi:indolepyruvate ferredoxin oxidoreductase
MEPTAASRLDTRLEDKYTSEDGWLYMTGIQALVRLPIQQRLRDAAAGRSTGGYISGYRGSPMGRYDMELWAAADLLTRHNIQFRAGLNEDLAATAIWGSQYVGAFPGNTVDGVFGIWYGKGPGVDRSGDALRHANLAGTSPQGGVLAIAGDDHGAKSSTVANFSDQIFSAVGMPVLYPSNTQELLDYGLHGIAMSRHSGCWVGMKVVTDVVEGGGSVHVGPARPSITLPDAPALPGGLNIRRMDGALPQEDRLYHHKLHAALDYVRANGLNRVMVDSNDARIGIVSAGKAWQDVVQAMRSLGLSDDRAAQFGIRMLKIGMTWPLDPVVVQEFARGLELIVVVEEKRPILEDQIRGALYGGAHSPRIVGKHLGASAFDPGRGERVFANAGELSPDAIAQVLRRALGERLPHCGLAAAATSAVAPASPVGPMRMPGFCSGCPHNRSTRVIDGSRALAGIGCHTMAMLIDPTRTTTVSHMGAEGVMWLGQQAFTTEKHVFANLGDGTYAHSGFLAVRQAVAAHVPITYKLLCNGFVAMTGGQAVETGLSPAQILHGLAAEGVKKMALVTDDPSRYDGVALPAGVKVHARGLMEAVQVEFRTYPDVSVILYDQACATERRRLRKRGKWPDPPKRTFINAAVCEGCGDCGAASNCMSIEPLQTDLGRKRRINQDSCNKDFTCVEGFCPSFVTVHGGHPRKAEKPSSPAAAAWTLPLPEPEIPALDAAFDVIVGGIGGTGVVTIGQTLAVAAHVQGLFSSNLDVTGLSQKYGAVMSHVRLAPAPGMLHATRIGIGEARTLIGCDLIVASGAEAMSKLDPQRSCGVVCTDVVPTNDFARSPDWSVDAQAMRDRLQAVLGDRLLLVEGLRLARALLGDAIASNMFMLGAAWQLGQIPLRLDCIDRAIELNGVAIPMNREAFTWGRRAAHDLAAVERFVAALSDASARPIRIVPRTDQNVSTLIERRSRHLVEHTGERLADRYLAFVARVRAAETAKAPGDSLTRAVAESYFKLLAVKDEWEVARLYDHPDFRESLAREFDGDFRLHFHLGAWPFARRDPATGRVGKAELGPWVLHAFRWMARLRRLRGTWLDPFRRNEERRLDARLLSEYEKDIDAVLHALDADAVALAVRIAALPMKVRGYGHVKQAQAAAAQVERDRLFADWRAAGSARPAEAVGDGGLRSA